MLNFLIWLALVSAGTTLGARGRAGTSLWALGLLGAYALALLLGLLTLLPALIIGVPLVATSALLLHRPWRLRYLSKPLMARIREVLPPMSTTEREAIEAGDIWWEAELFSGDPDWDRLLSTPVPVLREDEHAFIDGPVERLCEMLDDWDITHERHDLPAEVWALLKKERFFGMIIPTEFGGRGFSAYAHSQAVMKICSRSVTAGVTVMVPNSLGPAELIYHYGTDAQKDHYLPRLASGEEIPCFALTGPTAGSDAGAIPDYGLLCRQEHEGREVLGFRLTWEKRYITLAPVATLLGLAFKAHDPDGLLGDERDLGVTCALVPTSTPGVEIGRRHNPLDVPFQNGPTTGQDVFIPLDWVIGGEEGIGRGWKMLVESLSAGRGISLPAMGTTTGKMVARVSGNYSRIRRQFGLPIGKFEGIREPLARIGGTAYMMDSARVLTLAALDQGIKPAVVSAMLKYHNTEGMRRVMNDGMDIHGGRGICIGPRNYLARGYQGVPIAITVEGANILTRSMIVFGQGALRCHPYLLKEMETATGGDLEAFDQAIFDHLGHTFTNAARSLVYGLSRSRLAASPVGGPMAKYFRRLARMSAAYSLLADLALALLGGALKRKEHLSGRFSDALVAMFVCSAVLKHYEEAGRPREELPLAEWSARYCLYQVQYAIDEILRNFPVVWVGLVLRALVFPLGRRFRYPNDRLCGQVADLLINPSETRDRLTAGIYLNQDPNDPVGRLEHALPVVIAAEPLMARLKDLEQAAPGQDYDEWLQQLVAAGTLQAEEADLVRQSRELVRDVIMVDDFPGDARASAAGETDRAA